MCVFRGVREGEHQKQAATGIRAAGTNPSSRASRLPEPRSGRAWEPQSGSSSHRR